MTTAVGPTNAKAFGVAREDVLPDLGGHLPALDGLRGIAIALVMLCHFIPHSDQPHSLAGRAFFFISEAGWCGVDLFFVLSGFLITGILLDAKAKRQGHYFRNFYARRTLRIFPLYYFVLAVVFILMPLVLPVFFNSPELLQLRHKQGWLWTYTTNVKMLFMRDNDVFYAKGIDFNPFWSLAVEEHFYLVWPAVVWLVGRRNLIAVCCAVIAASLALRGWMYWHGGFEWVIYVFTPCRADALATGALLAAVLREVGGFARGLVKNSQWLTLVLGIVWVASLAVNPSRDRWWSMTLGYTLVAVFFGVMLVMSISVPARSAVGRPFNVRFMRLLGKYSYGLYVYHTLLHGTFARVFNQRHMTEFFRTKLHLGGAAYGASVLFYIALASTVSLAIAFTSWHLIEKQFLRLKRFFEYHQPRGMAASANTKRTS